MFFPFFAFWLHLTDVDVCLFVRIRYGDRNLASISDPEEIGRIVESVLDANPKELAAYKEVRFVRSFLGSTFPSRERLLIFFVHVMDAQGKTRLFGFFVGMVMKSSGGRADPKISNEILKSVLDG